VVRPLTPEEAGTVSKAGIIIPDTVSKDKPEQGIVVAVGTGKWDETNKMRVPLEVKVGDRVVFSKYGYDEIKVKDAEYYIVNESGLLAVME
jgi:chaperonin GroES